MFTAANTVVGALVFTTLNAVGGVGTDVVGTGGGVGSTPTGDATGGSIGTGAAVSIGAAVSTGAAVGAAVGTATGVPSAAHLHAAMRFKESSKEQSPGGISPLRPARIYGYGRR